MGVYLNSKKPYLLLRQDSASTYFVDKSEILAELVPVVELGENLAAHSGPNQGKGQKYIAITRPRRFGKTVMANMIASYFSKGVDSSGIFRNLKISACEWFEKHLNKHNVIHIMFNELPNETAAYGQYIARIKSRLIQDLRKAYPDVEIEKDMAVWDALNAIVEYESEERFIFVLDEWDFIYHQEFASDEDKKSFTKFLSLLLKDQPYVEMAYMTGILPIAKYSSGSELNMFFEFSMAADAFSEYFGFTDGETDDLYERYRKTVQEPKVSREGLKMWYDGYQTPVGKRLYNPRSVVGALTYNQLKSYWTSSGPYDEIYSAMVVYGFLSYADGYVSIPNKELMDKFADMVRQRPTFGYIYSLAAESQKMLEATKAGDTATMTDILERVHDTESPLIRYSDEAELSKVITFVYLQAREYYDIRQEDRSGKGCVDFIFYPYNRADDGIIIELNVDDTADYAIQQIRDRNYALNLTGRLGEEPKCTGRILAVGIAYNRKDANKRHICKVEVLREK